MYDNEEVGLIISKLDVKAHQIFILPMLRLLSSKAQERKDF